MKNFYNSWIPLNKEEFDHEWSSENIVFFFSSGYNKKSEEDEWRDIMFEMLPMISSVEKIKKENLNPKIGDYYAANNIEELKQRISYMAPPKDVFGIAKNLRENKPLYMPMIIKDGEDYKTISGRTRMSVSFILNYPVKAIVIDKLKLMNLVVLPIKRKKYLDGATLFVKSRQARESLLDYVDGKISLEELLNVEELNKLEKEKLDYEIDMANRYAIKTKTKSNPYRPAENLNLTQAMEIRDNQYRSRDAQFDYFPEDVDSRIYELQGSTGEKRLKKFLKEHEIYEPEKKKIKIKLKWSIKEDSISPFAVIELPDQPFYNVKVIYGKKDAFVIVNDGKADIEKKKFKNFEDAIYYAEKAFLEMAKDDPDYSPTIVDDISE